MLLSELPVFSSTSNFKKENYGAHFSWQPQGKNLDCAIYARLPQQTPSHWAREYSWISHKSKTWNIAGPKSRLRLRLGVKTSVKLTWLILHWRQLENMEHWDEISEIFWKNPENAFCKVRTDFPNILSVIMLKLILKFRYDEWMLAAIIFAFIGVANAVGTIVLLFWVFCVSLLEPVKLKK